MTTTLLSVRPVDALQALNAEQRSAVEHGLERESADLRPLLIIAGAGSGKTNTLAYRVANLVQHGVDPQRILLLTFSRRAAQEMERRSSHVLQQVMGFGKEPPKLPWSGTFHVIGARLLREYAAFIGLDESFTIHDRSDAEDLMGLVRHELGLSSKESRFPRKGTCLSIYSRVVNSQQPLGDVLHSTFPWCGAWEAELKRLFGGYVDAKQEQNALDYDDLLLFWSEMMSDPQLAAEVSGRFDHVLVDEYQDTNRLQSAILKALKPSGQGVTVVGDDAQSIYSFRGATVRNILDFPTDFAHPARIVTLERNYRSTQPILDVSNAVIAQTRERHAKVLWTDKAGHEQAQLVMVDDEATQARFVAERVLAHREAGLPLKSQAVLFRTSSHSAALELELMRRNIPFVKFGGLKFLETAHIKDVLALLRLVQNPRGRIAGLRVLQLMPGIGPATASKLLEQLAQAPEPAKVIDTLEVPSHLQKDWHAFVEVFQTLSQKHLPWPADLELARRWYQCRITGSPEDFDTRFPGTYNARLDNLDGFWRKQFGYTHWVAIVTAFFEYVVDANGKKVVLEFKPHTGKSMYVACLWSHWTAPGKNDLYSFAFITDEPPAEVLAAWHDRCIIPLKRENVDAWLDPDPKDLDSLYDILEDRERPYFEHRVAS